MALAGASPGPTGSGRAARKTETSTTHNTRTLGGSYIRQRLTGLRANLAERTARYRLYRATLNELAMMCDRELADIGVDGADIRAVAHEAAYSDRRFPPARISITTLPGSQPQVRRQLVATLSTFAQLCPHCQLPMPYHRRLSTCRVVVNT